MPNDTDESLTATQAGQPRAPRTQLPLADDQSNPGPRLAVPRRAGKRPYRLELFEKAKATASLRLEHVFSGALVRFELPGTASERKAQGAKATARVGDTTVEWTAFADGLKEDIVLDKRPNQDEVRFNVEMQRLSPVADGKGGYVLYDSYSHPRFHVLAPTVHDAAGQQGKASLELTNTRAVIRVDPGLSGECGLPGHHRPDGQQDHFQSSDDIRVRPLRTGGAAHCRGGAAGTQEPVQL